MSKRLIVILAFAFVVGVACAAYAEVQNVKVSGDLDMKGVFRNNFDLTKTTVSGHNQVASYEDKREYFMSIARVRVDADLTDNVSATVRLINERNWNGESTTADANRNMNIGGVGTIAGEQDVNLDLAYATLKEFLYSPLTLTVGRQELHIGNDWIVGDPDTNMYSLQSNLSDGDLSARKAFDALRATLDYNPLVVDVIYAKIAEKNTATHDDTTLTGLNASYEVDKNTTVEGFFFSKMRGSQDAAVTNVDTGNATSFLPPGTKEDADVVNTIGGRVVNKTVKNLTVDAQAAYQFGKYNPKFDPNARYTANNVVVGGIEKAETQDRSAWGLEVGASYDLKDIALLSKYSPVISATYIRLSGANRDQTGNKDYNGWDPMFENQTFGSIMNAIFASTNSNTLNLSLAGKVVDDLSLKLDATYLWTVKRYPEGRNVIMSGVSGARQYRMGKNPFLGQEYDLTLTYDYTEDVQLSLLGGIYLPTKAINGTALNNIDDNSLRAAATELIGSMKVTF